jgi:hypothetical protein
MTYGRRAIVAVGILLIAGICPAMATNSDRAPRNDEGSFQDVCNQFRQERQQLRDKQKHGTLTRGDRNRMSDLDGQIKSMCSN